MRTPALGTRSLLLGTLLLVSFFVVAPAVHAQTFAPLATAGPRATADATKAKKTIKTEICAAYPDNSQSPVPETSEKNAETDQGFCDVTYTDGTTNHLSWDGGAGGQQQAVQKDATGAPTAVTVTADPAAARTSSGGCGIENALDPSTWGDCLLNALATFLLGFSNFFLGIVGVLLNWVIVKTVFQFSTLIGNSTGLLAAWGILRDIGNLLLLFGFVLMGIGTILDTSKLPDKKAIPKLIIFAILLNFSIFAAEAVIDTSNVLTSVMYSQANTNPCVTDTCSINDGLAGKIMESTGLSGIYHQNGKVAPLNKLIVTIGLTLFATIGTVVLLAAAIMLAWRAVILTGLIIVSPIGFAGMALPGPFLKMARDWWKMLIQQSFFAPILFLLIFITLRVTDSFAGGATNNNTLADALGGVTGTDNMGVLMVFLIICGGLIASLMAAKKFGASGADFAVNTATKLTFGSQNIAYGLAGRGLRIAGQRGPLGDTAFGRGLASTGRFFERGGGDLRAAPLIGRGLQSALAGAGAGAAAKPADSLKEVGDKLKESPLNLKKRAREDREKYDAERSEQRAKDAKNQLAKDIKSGTITEPSERFLARLGGKELEAIPGVKQGNPAIIRALSPDQFESLMKSESITPAEKGRISDARFADLRTQIDAGDRAGIRQWTNKDLQQLAKSNATLFTQVVSATDASGASYLSDDQQENLAKSDSLTRTQRQEVRGFSVIGRIEAAVAPGGAGGVLAQRLAQTLNPKQKFKLAPSALTNSGVIATFTASDLGKIMEDGKLSDPQKATIAAAVRNPAHPNNASIMAYLAGNPLAASYWI